MTQQEILVTSVIYVDLGSFEIIGRCLYIDPAKRPDIITLQGYLEVSKKIEDTTVLSEYKSTSERPRLINKNIDMPVKSLDDSDRSVFLKHLVSPLSKTLV